MHEIKKEIWHTCKLCQSKIKDLAKKYGGSGTYYYQVFNIHLEKDHNMSAEIYFEKYTDRKKCACGICDKPVNLKKRGGFAWSDYACGRYPGLLEWSKQAKESRKGKNNPMYGATPWNKGKNADTNETLRKMGEKQRGKKIPESSKKRMSESAKKRKIHGHTGHKHSKETKEKLRQNTLRLIKEGKLKQTKTRPHKAMGSILKNLKMNFEEEKIIDCWSFDYYLIDHDIYIEVDGDYWHSNPKFYPDGPKTKGQKINWYRDLKKNKFAEEKGIILVRFWECDILNNPKEIECKLKELLELS